MYRPRPIFQYWKQVAVLAAIHRHVLERIDVELEKAFGVALR